MSLRRRIRRLQREFNRGAGELTLEDGTEIPYGELELFDALLAATEGGEHRLLPYIRQMDTEFGDLCRALDSGRLAAESEEPPEGPETREDGF